MSITSYQGIYASNNSVQQEDEEDLVVCMAYTIIHPHAMMILAFKRQKTCYIIQDIKKKHKRKHRGIPSAAHIYYIHDNDGHVVAYKGNTSGSISIPHPAE